MKNTRVISKMQVLQKHINFKALDLPERFFDFNVLI